jgi:hypothetical protein
MDIVFQYLRGVSVVMDLANNYRFSKFKNLGMVAKD